MQKPPEFYLIDPLQLIGIHIGQNLDIYLDCIEKWYAPSTVHSDSESVEWNRVQTARAQFHRTLLKYCSPN